MTLGPLMPRTRRGYQEFRAVAPKRRNEADASLGYRILHRSAIVSPALRTHMERSVVVSSVRVLAAQLPTQLPRRALDRYAGPPHQAADIQTCTEFRQNTPYVDANTVPYYPPQSVSPPR